MMRRRIAILSVFALLALSAAEVGAAERQVIAGAGPSTKVAEMFFEHFSKLEAAAGYEFVIPPRSIKHAGGIKASGKYVFGRTGRPLSKSELALGKGEILIAKVPMTFVKGSGVKVAEISTESLAEVFSGRITNWRDLGGPDVKLDLIGREKGEAALRVLIRQFPFMAGAGYDRTFTRDHQVVNFLRSAKGKFALAYGAKSNFTDTEVLAIQGVDIGGGLGLVYDLKNSDHPLVTAVRQFAASETWRRIVVGVGYMPVE